MKHVIKINQPDFVGSTVIAFDDEGKARAAVDLIAAAGDSRTTAEYLGRANTLPVYFTAANFKNSDQVNPPSLRQQAIEQYERALPHRVAYDVLDLARTNDGARGTPTEYGCVILGGFR